MRFEQSRRPTKLSLADKTWDELAAASEGRPRGARLIRPASVGDRNQSKLKCVYCDVALSKESRTEEHVFPQWVIRTFPVRPEFLRTANGQRKKFSSVTVPCCFPCNQLFGQLEKIVSHIVSAGSEVENSTAYIFLCAWSAKIILGILYLEWPYIDWKSPERSFQIPDDVAFSIGMYRHFLACILRNGFVHGTPATIIALEVTDHPKEFGFLDGNKSDAIAIKLGKFGLLFAMDWGAYGEAFLSGNSMVSMHRVPTDEFWKRAIEFLHLSNERQHEPLYLPAANEDMTPFIAFEPVKNAKAMFANASKESFDSFVATVLPMTRARP